jgi:hypothetical protein
MIIDRKRRLAFVHIPKTGGTSITAALFQVRGYEAQHRHGWQMERHDRRTMHDGLRPFDGREECTVFASVRNPFGRMLSYYSAVRRREPVGKSPPFVALIREAKAKAFDDWMEAFASSPRYAWFRRSQSEMIRCRDDRVDEVLRFERLADDWADLCARIDLQDVDPLPHANKSEHGHWRDEIGERGRAVIERLYARDLDELGYEW